MTTLSINKPRPLIVGDNNDLPVIANDIVYEGAAAGDNGSGYIRPLVSGDPFRGIALKKADNTGGSAGDVLVNLVQRGRAELAISGVALTDVGRPVYASDDDTFTLVGATNSYVGRVARYVSSGKASVVFDALQPEPEIIVTLPLQLAAITTNMDVVTTYTPGFAGRIKKAVFVVTTPVTTGSKLATLNFEIGTTNLTGGTIALTSANCTPLGATVAAAAITDGNSFTASDTISVEASSVTAFAEGQGYILLTLGK